MSSVAETLRAINAALVPWQGAQAQFWSYSASLATLEIRLFSAQDPIGVHLVCSPCVAIAGPVYWERCRLSVSADNSEEDLFLVCDPAAGVHIRCRQLHVRPNASVPLPPTEGVAGTLAASLLPDARWGTVS